MYTYHCFKKKEPNGWGGWFWIIFAILTTLFLFSQKCRAEEIDLSIIARIESNNNPLAYNRNSGAIGLCQITSICLNDFNLCNKTCYELTDLLSPKFNAYVAYWYLNKRIPQMLKAKHRAITLENILFAYNAGIGRVVKGIMPRETKQYIRKYKQLQKGK